MTDQQSTKSGTIWFGLFSIVMGLLPILAAADILPADESSFNAPRWGIMLAGFVFVSAGISVSLMDPIFDSIREKWWFSYLNHLGSYGVLLSMVIVFNWVAFGPGERQFSGGVSLPFITIWTDQTSEGSGRTVFGLLLSLWISSYCGAPPTPSGNSSAKTLIINFNSPRFQSHHSQIQSIPNDPFSPERLTKRLKEFT